MSVLNEFGVDPARVVPGARIRLADAPRGFAVVQRMDTPTLGRALVSNVARGQAAEPVLFHTDNVSGVGSVCNDYEQFPPPCWAADYLDFPTGWHIQRQGVIHVDHRCSAVQAWGGFLCDCGAVETEWKRRRTLMANGSRETS